MSAAVAATPAARCPGPITEKGRLASARNAVQHGFSGAGKCLPPDMEAELAAEVAMFAASHRPANDYERDLIRRAALGNLRARRLDAVEFALISERTREAEHRWDAAREDAVAALAARLDAEPEAALRHLKRTAHGCDFLGDAWEDLGRILTLAGHWDEAQAKRALRLLGLDADPTPTSPEPLREFWLAVLSLRFERDPAGMMRTHFRAFADPAAVRAFLPRPADARMRLAEVIRDQVAEYEALGQQLWESFDGPARASASTLAAFDPGPEAARLRRYRADAERLRARSLDELNRLRRDGAPAAPASPARNEPEPTPAPASPARNEPAIRPAIEARNESADPSGPASRNELARPGSRRPDDLVPASISPFDRCAVVSLSIAPDRS